MTDEEPIRTVADRLRVSNQLLNGPGGSMIHPAWVAQVYADLLRPRPFPGDPLAAARRRWNESLEPWPAKLRRRTAPARRAVRDARESVALRVAPWLQSYDEDY